MPDFLTLQEIALAARTNLSRNHWDYLIGAAETETTMKRNRASLDALSFRPRILHDVSDVRANSTFMGHALRLPVLLPPIGSLQVFESGGGASVAKAADAFGAMMMLSSVCTPGFEDVAKVGNAPKVFQLYLVGDQGWMDDHIARAIDAGYVGFCLTVDTAVYSRRERDVLKRFVPASGRQAGTSDFGFQAKMSWDTVAHIKDKFAIPLWLKGVNTGADAGRAVEAGVDVVYVSNHGGRQLDHGRGGMEALPEVVAAVEGRVPVVVDGGFMRGTDVIKGLCAGADLIGMGRFEALAMAAGGANAVVRALEILELEIRTSMALLGVASLGDLGPDFMQAATPMNDAHVLSALPLLAEGY
ncbi:MAG: alpha-hydroxy-acid oxidizing protein [Gammaproteobacteria bacterium]|nr:alpha-hydroxy-acid oxidizing protein [Gammaproteobacteria bacterium]